VPQAFFETLHRNPPQKIHIQPSGRYYKAERLDWSAWVRLVSMKVEPGKARKQDEEIRNA
jgi:hypothetical protein